LSDQLDHVHVPGLADAVGPIGGLILGGRVPPRVVVDYQIRACQVEAGAARFEGNEEDLAVTAVEAVAETLTFLRVRGAIQIQAGNTFPVQTLADDLQHAHKLAEDQHPPSGINGGVDGLHQQLQLAAGALVIRQEQLGMTAYLPQLQKNAEHLHPGPGQRAFVQRLSHMLPQRGQQRLIDPILLRRHGRV